MDLFSVPNYFLKKGRPPRAPLREEARWQRILHRPFTQEEMQEEVLLGYSRPVHPWWEVPQEHDWRRSQRRHMSWDGQIGERRPHALHHSRRNSSVSKQLVDPFEHSWFRYDARKASSWLQTSIVFLATAQKPRGYSSSAKMAKLFLILVELARILVASLIWDITTTMDLTLMERENLRKSVNALFFLWNESHNKFGTELQFKIR